MDCCPAEILSWLTSRWREENFLRYASETTGSTRSATTSPPSRPAPRSRITPARRAASTAARQARKALAAARADMAVMLADPAIGAAARNTRLIPAAQKEITRAETTLARAGAGRDNIPAKLPASVIGPDARTALPRTRRRGLQMVLRLLAHNAGHWMSDHLSACLRDDREYRAITRQTIIRDLAGAWPGPSPAPPAAITVELARPDEPRIARALTLLLDEISQDPPSLPGDTRPITYQLAAGPPEFNN